MFLFFVFFFVWFSYFFFFFFQAEDGIRDRDVTGVQTCALPISGEGLGGVRGREAARPPRRRGLGEGRGRVAREAARFPGGGVLPAQAVEDGQGDVHRVEGHVDDGRHLLPQEALGLDRLRGLPSRDLPEHEERLREVLDAADHERRVVWRVPPEGRLPARRLREVPRGPGPLSCVVLQS